MKSFKLNNGKIIKGYIKFIHCHTVHNYHHALRHMHTPESRLFRKNMTFAIASEANYLIKIEYSESILFGSPIIVVFDNSQLPYYSEQMWIKDHEIK